MKIFSKRIQDLQEIAELREFFSPQSNQDLVEMYTTQGQMSPVLITPDNSIIDGYRTVDAIAQAGGTTVIARVYEGEPNMMVRILYNRYRTKSTEDITKGMKAVFAYFAEHGEVVINSKSVSLLELISCASNGIIKKEKHLEKMEYILNHDLSGDVLTVGIIEKGWKVDTCYDFLTNYYQDDIEKGYGYYLDLIRGRYTITEIIKFIKERNKMGEKFESTFVIPDKANNYNMDCVKLAELPQFQKEVDLVFTSIPYWDLRTYKTGQLRQLGQERTKEEYTLNIARIFEKLTGTLKDSANVVINIGETYRGGVASGIPFLIRDYIEKYTSLVYKDTLIWSKKNPRPQGENVKRPVNSIEYCFWYVVDPKKAYYKLLTFPVVGKTPKVSHGAKDVASDGTVSKKSKSVSKPYGKLKSHLKEQEIENIITTSIGKNYDIARFSSAGHPAPMSPMLPVTIILMMCPEHGLVCDPFGGTNVVGKCALELNRRYIGCDISDEYYQIGCEMLNLGADNFDQDEMDDINDMMEPPDENDDD